MGMQAAGNGIYYYMQTNINKTTKYETRGESTGKNGAEGRTYQQRGGQWGYKESEAENCA